MICLGLLVIVPVLAHVCGGVFAFECVCVVCVCVNLRRRLLSLAGRCSECPRIATYGQPLAPSSTLAVPAPTPISTGGDSPHAFSRDAAAGLVPSPLFTASLLSSGIDLAAVAPHTVDTACSPDDGSGGGGGSVSTLLVPGQRLTQSSNKVGGDGRRDAPGGRGVKRGKAVHCRLHRRDGEVVLIGRLCQVRHT